VCNFFYEHVSIGASVRMLAKPRFQIRMMTHVYIKGEYLVQTASSVTEMPQHNHIVKVLQKISL